MGQGTVDGKSNDMKMRTRVRNWIGFWLLGLCNNYAYVIMLSAAHDLLSKEFHEDDTLHEDLAGNHTIVPGNHTTHTCNPMSTGAILLADILPSLMTKALSPFLLESTRIRVAVTITLSALSFIITAASISDLMSFSGVICASISSGLGEVTFLAYSASFDVRVVSGWSSGTGAAGLVGAGVYLLLSLFLKPRVTLALMLVIPVIMALTYWFLIVHPPDRYQLQSVAQRRLLESNESVPIMDMDRSVTMSTSTVVNELSLWDKLYLMRSLSVRFMIPLGMVYFFEYFINQGLFELVWFENSSLSQDVQYRLYNTLYQVGVFVSRSSVQFVRIRLLWILPIMQAVNFVLFLSHVINPFFGHISVAVLLILFEGLLGGASYVNTFYKISEESLPHQKSFAMAIVSLSDSMGITLAGAMAIPTHNALCHLINQRS